MQGGDDLEEPRKNILTIDPGGKTGVALVRTTPYISLICWKEFWVDQCHLGVFRNYIRWQVERADVVLIEEFKIAPKWHKTEKSSFYAGYAESVFQEVQGEIDDFFIIPATHTGILRKNLPKIWPCVSKTDYPANLSDHILDCLVLAIQHEFPLLVQFIIQKAC